jgi:hypothetical protein
MQFFFSLLIAAPLLSDHGPAAFHALRLHWES